MAHAQRTMCVFLVSDLPSEHVRRLLTELKCGPAPQLACTCQCKRCEACGAKVDPAHRRSYAFTRERDAPGEYRRPIRVHAVGSPLEDFAGLRSRKTRPTEADATCAHALTVSAQVCVASAPRKHPNRARAHFPHGLTARRVCRHVAHVLCAEEAAQPIKGCSSEITARDSLRPRVVKSQPVSKRTRLAHR